MSNPKPRLLVVDDEAGICLSLYFLLQDLFEVVTAESVQDGTDRLQEHFDLILLDLCMPGVSGYSFLEHVRKVTPDTPVAILSAAGDRSTRAEVLQRGAAALIEKPFSRQELLTHIRDIIGIAEPAS